MSHYGKLSLTIGSIKRIHEIKEITGSLGLVSLDAMNTAKIHSNVC